ncbi:hypothetical protein BC332_29033 [Capsicum chinense]|nr:hypothetical protein BC332_29033 [Capsicum chinense]
MLTILCQFPFTPGVNSFSVDVHRAAMNLCVLDPGISSKFKALIDYTVNTLPLILLDSTMRESKVDDTYSDVNRVFDDNSQGAVSRELQPIAPHHIIRLPKLFRFLQQLLAQLIFVLQAPKSKVWNAAIGGDKIIVCPPTFSLYEVVALQTCENDHGSLRVEECTIAHQVLNSNSVFKALHNVDAIQIKFLSHHGISMQIQFTKLGKTYGAGMGPSLIERSRAFAIIVLARNYHCFFLLYKVPMEMNKEYRLRGTESFSNLKQSYCLAAIWTWKGNEIASSFLQVDSACFHLRTTIAALYTHSSLERFSIILSMLLHSNLEDKVLITTGYCHE